ncbi:MAG: bifunctional UDP-N-acetylmuramoyl-tripeptide:D-alanyl-D-alanine ligase/alanine racemase [Muribaculaceae bacterium]|nr:bifunctional UDP-N-acetylmuramoyl-tripeptide:D-alanyl-D-alanine ligase/alanine racemase [Muribaculaceae bacterium]
MNYSITEICNVLEPTGGHIIDEDAIVSQLLTDSRSLTMPQETIFFALRTDAGDGHNYIPDLFSKGVRNFVVTNDYFPLPECTGANYLAVDSPLDALQTLATFHRRRFRELPVIGITGSRGKTTVKEWLYQLLKDDYRIVRSPRSYNSQIGVPLSLWEIDVNTDLAIIEAGISTTGEMDNLQSMIRPTIGIITNLGSEHNDGFVSMEQKAQEKAKILYNCESVVFCADDPLVTHTIAPLVESDVATAMSWSRNHCEAPLQVERTERTDNYTTLRYTYNGEQGEVTIPFTADRDLDNAITCLAVMLQLDVERYVIANRMAMLTPVGTRLNVIEGVNDCTVIVDSYTSDYYSLTPALNFMTRRAGNRPCTVILSDLATESYSGDELYIRVSELLKTKRVNRLVGIGKEMCRYCHYFDDLPHSRCYNDTQEFLNDFAKGDFDDETILIKGDPRFGFSQIIDLLEAKQHMTVMEVDLNALAHNFKFFKSLIKPETKTVGMVKASGYGAGSYEIAKTLQDCGCDYLAVAVHDEGVELRKAGITTMPIIVLNPNGINYKAMFQYRLEPELYCMEMARELIKEGKKYGVKSFPVHIKIDSGMHRLGFTREQLPELIEFLKGQDIITPASVFSHLSVADDTTQDDYTRGQFDYFDQCCEMLQQSFDHYIMRHILNTSGIVRFPDKQYDMVRIGIGLYGIRTLFDGSEDALKPVSALRSIIISIKDWPAGTTVGYGRRGVLQRDSRIATITIGYADGFDRHFGNGAVSMWVNGKLCPTVGTVCMDAVMIDVTDVPCKVGDTVEIFGEHVPVENLSDARGTIPYEILTSVSPRVKRVYYRE